MLKKALSSLSARFYAIVALAVLMTAILSWVLVNLAVDNAYAMREKHLSDVTDTAVSVLAELEAQVADGSMTRDEAMAEGRRRLTDLSFGDSGYFYVFDTDNIYQVHPSHPEWIGTDQSDYQDVKGLYLFQEMTKLAKTEGSGAITYYFTRPDSDVPEAKLGYVKLFEPWNWIVGTGSYVNDIQADLAHLWLISRLILGGSLIVLVLISTLSIRSVTKPLSALRLRMQSLAEGEIEAEVPHLNNRSEIGGMARTVAIFRDALTERERLEQAQAEKDAILAQERERAAEQERLAREREERDAEARRVAEEKARADQEAQRAKADAERAAAQAEQGEVMAALAIGLGAIAHGDLTVQIDHAFPAAYEELRHDFNEAVSQIASLAKGIVESSGSISNETDTLNGAAMDLSQRTERQAASLTETATAISELSSSVHTSADNAHEAASVVTDSRDQSERGRAIVQQAVEAMTAIATNSAQISTITNVIDEIAFQTNLLALNAGVEAARAGEAGRGFAVVASEVRALAQRSSEAAREISDQIETSTQQVEAGVKLVNDSGDALGAIEELVTKLDGLVQGIAESASAQSSGLQEITIAIDQLDEVTQQNAAMFEETTAAVQVLKTQAGVLQRATAALTLDTSSRSDQAAFREAS
ncbi:MAG: methyl-accepting chemotaxis protein [Maritimibacter sp.]